MYELKLEQRCLIRGYTEESRERLLCYCFDKADSLCCLRSLIGLRERADKLLKGRSSVSCPMIMVLKLSHLFNLLDARKAISVAREVSVYRARVRKLARMCAELYLKRKGNIIVSVQ